MPKKERVIVVMRGEPGRQYAVHFWNVYGTLVKLLKPFETPAAHWGKLYQGTQFQVHEVYPDTNEVEIRVKDTKIRVPVDYLTVSLMPSRITAYSEDRDWIAPFHLRDMNDDPLDFEFDTRKEAERRAQNEADFLGKAVQICNGYHNTITGFEPRVACGYLTQDNFEEYELDWEDREAIADYVWKYCAGSDLLLVDVALYDFAEQMS